MKTAKQIAEILAERVQLTEAQQAAIVEILNMAFTDGYKAARTTAVNAFDEMWSGTEEEPAGDYFEPDMDYHRTKFINAFMW